jgi:hypothetical protein
MNSVSWAAAAAVAPPPPPQDSSSCVCQTFALQTGCSDASRKFSRSTSAATATQEPHHCQLYEPSVVLELSVFFYVALLAVVIILGSVFLGDGTDHVLLYYLCSWAVPLSVLHARNHLSPAIVDGSLAVLALAFLLKSLFLIQSVLRFSLEKCSLLCLEHPLVFLLQILLAASLLLLDLHLFLALLRYRRLLMALLRDARKQRAAQQQ